MRELFGDAELLEWIVAVIVVPLAGWAIWLQHAVNQLSDDISDLKDLARMTLQNTAIQRGMTSVEDNER